MDIIRASQEALNALLVQGGLDIEELEISITLTNKSKQTRRLYKETTKDTK